MQLFVGYYKMPVFIGEENSNGSTHILMADNYQESSYYIFMYNKDIEKLTFNYSNSTNFSLRKFIINEKDEKEEDSNNYSTFCILENDKGEKYILSNCEYVLKKFKDWKTI